MVAMSSCGTGVSAGVPGWSPAAVGLPERQAADRVVGRGVAAEQAGVGDVLDVPHRGPQRSGVVPGLADGGADRGGADLRPGRVVPVNMPRHAVHVQARREPPARR